MGACEKWALLRTKGYGQQMPSLAVLHLQPGCGAIAGELNIRVDISAQQRIVQSSATYRYSVTLRQLPPPIHKYGEKLKYLN